MPMAIGWVQLVAKSGVLLLIKCRAAKRKILHQKLSLKDK